MIVEEVHETTYFRQSKILEKYTTFSTEKKFINN